MEDLAPALGLAPQHVRLLVALAEQVDSTSVSLAALTGLSRPQVSAALHRLEQLGLVVVTRLRRPHLVSLVTDVEPPLEQLLLASARTRAEQERRAVRAADELRALAAAVALTPRAPEQRRRVPGIGPAADHDLLAPQRTYDEVARPEGTTVQFGVQLRDRSTRRRLLVLAGEVPRHARSRWAAEGVQVRGAVDELPALVVVDGERARVEIGTSAVGRHAWTFDRRQVAALGQLFDLWWTAAETT